MNEGEVQMNCTNTDKIGSMVEREAMVGCEVWLKEKERQGGRAGSKRYGVE
jgi:hypothetical protein